MSIGHDALSGIASLVAQGRRAEPGCSSRELLDSELHCEKSAAQRRVWSRRRIRLCMRQGARETKEFPSAQQSAAMNDETSMDLRNLLLC